MEDNDMMVHDYLHEMISEMLLEVGEVLIPEEIIKGRLSKLLNGTTPHFIVVWRGRGWIVGPKGQELYASIVMLSYSM